MAVHDLREGLFREGLWPKLYWGKFKSLDKTVSKQEWERSMLFRWQIEKFQAIENSLQLQRQYQNANDFINSASTELSQLDAELSEKTTSQVYQRLIDLLNAGLATGELNPIRDNASQYTTNRGHLTYNYYDVKTREEKTNTIIHEITDLLQQLRINQPLDAEIVKTLEDRLKTMRAGRSKATSDYTSIKADWAEQLAVEMVEKTPNLRGLQTGFFLDWAGDALIEDVMAFNKKNLNQALSTSNGVKLQMTIAQVGKRAQGQTVEIHSVNDLFQQIEKINKSDGQYQIYLSDPLYAALRTAAAFNAQVKSGVNQPILTNAARNSMTLATAGLSGHDLWKLYTLDLHNKQDWFKPTPEQSSETLSAITNYYLSKSIAKTNLVRNQVYFTKYGITTVSKWMELTKNLLIFQPAIKSIGPDFLSEAHTYRFVNV